MIKRKTKKSIYILTTITVLCVAYFVCALLLNLWPFTNSNSSTDESNRINLERPTSGQKEAGERISNQSKSSNNDQDYSQEDDVVSIEITALNQNEENVVVRTLVHTLSSGTCTLTLSNNEYGDITKTAKTHPLANVSSCQGFNIPKSELQPGKWSVEIVFANNKTSGSAKKEITVQ